MSRSTLLSAVLFAGLILSVVPAHARPINNPSTNLEREDIEARLALLTEADPDAEKYRLALEALDRASSLANQTREYTRLAEEADDRLAETRETLNTPLQDRVVAPDPDASLAQLRASESEAAAALQAAKDQAEELASEAARRDVRRREIPQQLELARQRQAALRAQLNEADAAIDITKPADVLVRTQLAQVSAEISMLEAENASYEARRDLLPARRDLAERRIASLENALATWREAVRNAAALEAQRTAEQAEELRRRAATQDGVLQAYAEENTQLIEQLDPEAPIPSGTRVARDRLADVRDAIEQLRLDYGSIRARLRAADLNQATGRLLRGQFEQLEDLEELERRTRLTRRLFEEAEYRLIERRETRNELRNIDREVARLLEQVSDADTADEETLEEVARELVTTRRNVLTKLVNDASRHVEVIFTLKRAEQQLLSASTAYRSFIRERILWVRSLPADRGPRRADLRELAEWSTHDDAWQRTWNITSRWLVDEPARWGMPILLVALALAGAFAAPGRQRRISEKIRRPATDSIWQTVPALGWTLARALPLSAFLFIVGWILRRPQDQTELGIAIGQAAAGASLVWFGFAFLRSLTMPDGVAEQHFRWPSTAAARIRKDSLWAGAILAISMACMAFTDSSGLVSATATLGRLGFTAGAIATSCFVFRVLHPKGPVVRQYVQSGEGRWFHKLRFVVYWPLVLLPIAFVVIAWLGYVYTAYQLSWLLALTFFLIVLVAIGNMFLRRWLFVTRRRLAIEEARRRRAEASQQSENATPAPIVTESGPTIEEERIDLAGLSAQARQLIRVASAVAILAGLLGIWGDFLPALRLLERVEIYPRMQISHVEQSPEDEVLRSAILIGEDAGFTTPSTPTARPNGAASAREPILPPMAPGQLPTQRDSPPTPDDAEADAKLVTLADVGVAILFLLATIIAFRNLPALIEIFLLQRLPLDTGSRYAIDTILKYAIAILGTFATLGAVGISWSNVQWLAAALTFGLAFGLQEIFANFISGLIILAERPIRIGDTVTVQNVSGTVSRIRMRATTITDWELKELVIPNKTFITGDVVNWTLSDTVLRVGVPVGVSYGTDIDEAERLLVSAAQAEENVLTDPAPYVNFASFGESTLDLELRVFVPHIDYLLSTRHALHKRIIKVFREAGIEIAFPQRDLHLRSSEGLTELVRKRDSLNRDEAPDA